MLTGGPGTGKTTTVAGLLALLAEQAGPGSEPRVALTAPTGKAAARLQEAVARAAADLPAEDRARVGPSPPRPPCTGCSAAGPTHARGSATTATTGCRTT